MAATDDYIRGYLVGLELAKRLAGLTGGSSTAVASEEPGTEEKE